MSEALLRTIELQRCAAIAEGRTAELAALLADDLVHIHATGYADTKASYLDGLARRIDVRSVDRGPIDIRLIGEAAIMTGALTNVVRLRGEIDWQARVSLVTQVWRRAGDRWLLASYHACAVRADEARA